MLFKVYTKQDMIELLEKNDKFLERAIIQLFYRQTEDEKQLSDSKHTNNRGFNKPDSRRMSIYAKVCLAKKNQHKGEGNRLEDWMKQDARKRIIKYAGQLAEIANKKAFEKSHEKG